MKIVTTHEVIFIIGLSCSAFLLESIELPLRIMAELPTTINPIKIKTPNIKPFE